MQQLDKFPDSRETISFGPKNSWRKLILFELFTDSGEKKYIQQKYAKCFDVICLKTKINYTYQSSESWHTDEQSYFLLQRRYSTTQTVGKLQVLAKTCSLTSQLTGQTLLINGVQSGFPQRFFKA